VRRQLMDARAQRDVVKTLCLNDKLSQLNTYNGPADGRNPVETHSVSYTLDPNNVSSQYLNGNRTQDKFTLTTPAGTSAPCTALPSNCVATYTYDPRDRLVQDNNGHGGVTSYVYPQNTSSPLSAQLGLDPTGNIAQENIQQNGTLTAWKDYDYNGTQLQKLTINTPSSSQAQLYWYNDDGDLNCVTTSVGTSANCPVSITSSPSTNLISSYQYDYLFRLQSFRGYSNGTQTDCATYVYDPLDRLISESETHGSATSCNAKTTQFSYLGTTNNVTEEQQLNSTNTLQTTKDYTYDAYGHRLTETNTPAGSSATTYSYGYNVHDSVSVLLDPTGAAKATYGYRPYGDTDTALTQGDPDPNNPINAYRYEAKRYDSGSKTIDAGSRRFGTDTSKFLQPDQYNGALANLRLSLDPLSQNRYNLAGGNPLSSIEWDGHRPIPDGGGGADDSPNPGDTGELHDSHLVQSSPSDDANACGTFYRPCPTPGPDPMNPAQGHSGLYIENTKEGSWICKDGIDVCILSTGLQAGENANKTKWVKVKPYIKGNGTPVDSYYRTLPGGEVRAAAFAKLGFAIDFLVSAESQYEDDQKNPKYTDEQRKLRALTAGGVHAAVAFGGAALGEALTVGIAEGLAGIAGAELGPGDIFVIGLAGAIAGGFVGDQVAGQPGTQFVFQLEGFSDPSENGTFLVDSGPPAGPPVPTPMPQPGPAPYPPGG